MDLKELQKNWDEFGKSDPLWAIATHPDKKGRKWKEDEFFQLGVKEVNEIMKYIEPLNLNVLQRKALDFGCGVGRLTQALSEFFDEVIGVDIAPSMIELANKYNKHKDRCRYILNASDDMKIFSDNEFDFIYTNFTLQHMEPRYARNYIKEFLRILNPTGLLIFQVVTERIQNRPSHMRSVEVKKKIKAAAPQIVIALYHILINCYHRRRQKDDQPVMEMYGMQKDEVIRFLGENSAKVLDVFLHGSDPMWQFMRFCVSKK